MFLIFKINLSAKKVGKTNSNILKANICAFTYPPLFNLKKKKDCSSLPFIYISVYSSFTIFSTFYSCIGMNGNLTVKISR